MSQPLTSTLQPPSPVVLAVTHHDPTDSMLAQVQRSLPLLQQRYAAVVVLSSPQGGAQTTAHLQAAGVQVQPQTVRAASALETMGLVRLETIRTALDGGAEYVHLCDFDRALHWVEQWPDELDDVIDGIPLHDFLILGRTPRAFATHPRVQRDTEAIVNHTFGLAFGDMLNIDITAASRGLSRRAAALLLALDQPEPSIGNDAAWPLYLARFADLRIGYATTEGLEWETPDRFGDEIAAAGGLDAWITNFDADPQHWEFRARLALHEIEAINRWRV